MTEPTVEERLEAFEYALRSGENNDGKLRHYGANLMVDALALLRAKDEEIARLRSFEEIVHSWERQVVDRKESQ